MFKILVVGDVCSGKTAIVEQFVHHRFDPVYKSTVACEFALKILTIDGHAIRLQLWDIAGQDRLGGISKLFCRDAHAAIVVCDLTKKQTLTNTVAWKQQVDSHVCLPNEQPIPMVLAANKYDLVEDYENTGRRMDEYMTQGGLDDFADDAGFVGAFRTSAKTGHNVTEAFCCLIREVLKQDLSMFDHLGDDSENGGPERFKRTINISS